MNESVHMESELCRIYITEAGKLKKENDKLVKKTKQLEMNRRVLDKYIDELEYENIKLKVRIKKELS